MNKIRITIDPGHGINYNRGINTKYYESNVMYDLALRLKYELERYGIFEVYNTKSKLADNPSLDERGKKAIDTKSRLFISLHSNACDTESVDYVISFGSVKLKGAETFTKGLTTVVDGVFKRYNVSTTANTSVWNKTSSSGSDYYGVIRSSVVNVSVEQSVLIEHSFHTNLAVTNTLLNEEFIEDLAVAEAEYIYNHFKKYYIGDKVDTVTGIIKSTVNVRTGGSTNYQIIGSATANMQVKVVSRVGEWYKVIWNGAAGFIHGNYINFKIDIPDDDDVDFGLPKIEFPTKPNIEINEPNIENDKNNPISEGFATVNADTLNVRSGAGLQYEVIQQIYRGDRIHVLKADNSEWRKVIIEDKTGYVFNEYLTHDIAIYKDSIIKVTGSVNYRCLPGIDEYGKLHTVVGSLKDGDKVLATKSSVANWAAIRLNNISPEVYYIEDKYLIMDGEETPPITQSKELDVGYGKVTTTLNVRSGPDTSYAKLGTFTKDQYIIIISKSGDWFETYYGGKKAYCHSGYVDVAYKAGEKYATALAANILPKAEDIINYDATEWFEETLTGTLTSPFGNRTNPITGEANSFHSGIDIGAEAGKIIHSPVDGLCILNEYSTSYGNIVKLLAKDGTQHYFCHMRSRSKMIVGKLYSVGAVVGEVGTTGSSTRNHLHYEIRKFPYGYTNDTFNPQSYNYVESDFIFK